MAAGAYSRRDLGEFSIACASAELKLNYFTVTDTN
jgi:hypothetical protein